MKNHTYKKNDLSSNVSTTAKIKSISKIFIVFAFLIVIFPLVTIIILQNYYIVALDTYDSMIDTIVSDHDQGGTSPKTKTNTNANTKPLFFVHFHKAGGVRVSQSFSTYNHYPTNYNRDACNPYTYVRYYKKSNARRIRRIHSNHKEFQQMLTSCLSNF